MALACAARDMPLVMRAFNDHWSVCMCVYVHVSRVAGGIGLNHQGRVKKNNNKKTYYTNTSFVTEKCLEILLLIFHSGFL